MDDNTVSININGKLIFKISAIIVSVISCIILSNSYNNNRLYNRFLAQHEAAEASKTTARIFDMAAAYVPGDSLKLVTIQDELNFLGKQLEINDCKLLLPLTNNHIVIRDYRDSRMSFQPELTSKEAALLKSVHNQAVILSALKEARYIRTIHEKNGMYLITESDKAD